MPLQDLSPEQRAALEEIYRHRDEKNAQMTAVAEALATDPAQLSKGRAIGALLSRMAGGAASGVVGFVPTPVTTPTAAALGGLGELAAQSFEGYINWPRVASEAALSAVPLSKVYKGGKLVSDIARGALLAEAGHIGRRLTTEGKILPQEPGDIVGDLVAMASGGVGGLIPFRARQKGTVPGARKGAEHVADIVEDIPVPTVTARPQTRVDPITGLRVIRAARDLRPDAAARNQPGSVVEAGEIIKKNLATSIDRIGRPIVRDARTAGKAAARQLASTEAAKRKAAIEAGRAELATRRAARAQAAIDEKISGMAGIAKAPVSVTTTTQAKGPLGSTTLRETLKEVTEEAGPEGLQATGLTASIAETPAGQVLEAFKTAAKQPPKLTKGLAKATPTYNIGFKKYTPQFANDIDKAAFIVSQRTPLKNEASYLRWLQKHGIDTDAARAHGARVKQAIRDAAKDQAPGKVKIPAIAFGPPTAKETAESVAETAARALDDKIVSVVSQGKSLAAARGVSKQWQSLEDAIGVIKPESTLQQLGDAEQAARLAYREIKALHQTGQASTEELRQAGIVVGKLRSEVQKAARTQGVLKSDVTQMSLEDIAKLPHTEQERALHKVTDALKNVRKQGGDETGIAQLDLLLGGVGAFTGAAMTPDDPLSGALIGGGLGLFGPTAVRAAIRHLNTSSVPAATKNASAEVIAKKSRDVSESAASLLGMGTDWYRANLLLNNYNLVMNMYAGPWGSGVMGMITYALPGSPHQAAARAALKELLNIPGWVKAHRAAMSEARKLIRQGTHPERAEWQDAAKAFEGYQRILGDTGAKAFRRYTEAPGVLLTAGDLATRNILMKHGFSEEFARRITLTSNPYLPMSKAIEALKTPRPGRRRSAFWDFVIPFYRTNANQFEQSLERFPGIGLIMQRYARPQAGLAPDPKAIQAWQQFIGGNVAAASYWLGHIVPEEDNRYVIKAINNLGGQYGMIASSMFLIGQAAKNRKPLVTSTVLTLERELPLPSISGPVWDISAGRIPYGIIPAMVQPREPTSVPGIISQLMPDAPVPNARPPRPSRLVRPSRPQRPTRPPKPSGGG